MNTTQITQITQSIEDNNTNNSCRCMARIKTNIHKQCSRKKKQNSDLCGIHMRAKHVLRITEDVPEINVAIQKTTSEKIKQSIKKNVTSPNIITYKDLERNKFNSKKCNYRDILDSLLEYNLQNLKNKQKNFIQLQEYLSIRYHTNVTYTTPFYITKIILITKIYRGHQVRNINTLKGPGFLHIDNVNNKTDFLNFIDIQDIGYYHFISYKDNHNCIYAFHLDSLLSYISELKKIKSTIKKKVRLRNPYTQVEFPTQFLERIYLLQKKIPKIKISLLESIPLSSINGTNSNNINNSINGQSTIYNNISPKLKIKRICVDIFQRMDELELYTQARWFLKLNLYKLKKLYFYMEDIWHFRSRLTLSLKKNYVKNGRAFIWPYQYIRLITDKIKIQHILLNEFYKFVYEGKTREDCITASYWILMGLTMVSPEAASGCPALVQSNYRL